MKIFIIILVTLLSACSVLRNTDSSSQSFYQHNNYVNLKNFKGDTLGYVQHNFLDNKQMYAGKDLNTLLKDVEIPVKSFIPVLNELDNKSCSAIHLFFHSVAQDRAMMSSPQKPVDLIIIWSAPLLFDSVYFMWKKNDGEWTDVNRKYFGKHIVKDIMTTKYH
jgi:hypothetical protein